MSKYKKVLKRRKGYTYKHPKTGKKVKVPSGKQHYRVRVYRTISREEAQKAFDKRSDRSKALDKAKTSKNLKQEPDEEWKEDPSRSDVQGIDTPIEAKKVNAREKGLDLVDTLLSLKKPKEKDLEIINLTSSELDDKVPGLKNLKKDLREGKIILTSEDIDKLEAHLGNQWKLREIRAEVEGIEKIKDLERRKKALHNKPKAIEISKFNEETYQVLNDTLGTEDPLTSEDITDAHINNMSQIMGPDRKYGLERSWLGYSEYGKDTEYEPGELDRLEEGAIIERNTRRNREYFRKVNGDWYLIGERDSGGGYTLKGVVPKAIANKEQQNKLEAIVKHADDLSSRMLAIEDLNNKELLENIAVSDESYRMRSKAYHRLKELDPDDSRLKGIRSYYSEAKKRQEKQRHVSEEARDTIGLELTYYKPTAHSKKIIEKNLEQITTTDDIKYLLDQLRKAREMSESTKKKYGKKLLNKVPRSLDKQVILNKLKRRDKEYYNALIGK
jgi:hypothetical protein